MPNGACRHTFLSHIWRSHLESRIMQIPGRSLVRRPPEDTKEAGLNGSAMQVCGGWIIAAWIMRCATTCRLHQQPDDGHEDKA